MAKFFNQRAITVLALLASLLALSVIGLGAFTRLIDAGLGCPDWPGCYGHLTVPLQNMDLTGYPGAHFVRYKALAEMIHRYFAGTLSVLVLSLVIFIFNQKTRRFSNLVLAGGLILLIAYQIILGQLTVTLKLLPIVVTQHLLGGFLILTTLWLIYLNNQPEVNAKQVQFSSNKLFILGIIGVLLLLLQISLGAWTSTNYASLSCTDFPFCQNAHPLMPLYFKQAFNVLTPVGVNYEGGVLPEWVRQTIQMTHRLGALILTVYLFLFAALALPQLKNQLQIAKLFYLILGLLCIQIALGITNVLFKLPLITAIAHNLIAVLLLLASVTVTFKLGMLRQKKRSSA